MKLCKIEVENFRLLKNFSIDIEDKLSLVVGKNNTGKTSLLTVLEKFLNPTDRNRFNYDDFNIELKTNLERFIEEGFPEGTLELPAGIKLRLFIQYGDEDDLSNVAEVMMDLDPENSIVVLGFEYTLQIAQLDYLKSKYLDFRSKEEEKRKEDQQIDECPIISKFLTRYHSDHFRTCRKTIRFDHKTEEVDYTQYIDITPQPALVSNLINFKFISAKRDVTNKERNETLSNQTSTIYRKIEKTEEQDEAIDNFQDQLAKTDHQLTGIYSTLFDSVIKKVKKFGGIKENDSVIKVISTLQHRELLSGNTTVTYEHEGAALPENYNGLGYMNLISIIFQIEILLNEFKKSKTERPADINFLFIEEPEAHTHPQMQYVFIKNIKSLLSDGIVRSDGENRTLQYVVSTHSSHIVAESSFDDIKYLKKEGQHSVIAKNLCELKEHYIHGADNEENPQYRFLKQYLTLNRAELFFADKAILIEGDTESILLPAMMKKLDQTVDSNPLLSQNISLIEVGAHSHIYERFLNFIGINKYLIITDIDSCKYVEARKRNGELKLKANGEPQLTLKACPVDDPNACKSTNSSLKFFHEKYFDDTLAYFKNLSFEDKILKRNGTSWDRDEEGNLLLVYQTEEEGYNARSFEDAFFHLNKSLLEKERPNFSSLVQIHTESYLNEEIDVYEFAEKAVTKKPALAIEILLSSRTDEAGTQFSNWEIPSYIKEGLEWLRN